MLPNGLVMNWWDLEAVEENHLTVLSHIRNNPSRKGLKEGGNSQAMSAFSRTK